MHILELHIIYNSYDPKILHTHTHTHTHLTVELVRVLSRNKEDIYFKKMLGNLQCKYEITNKVYNGK